MWKHGRNTNLISPGNRFASFILLIQRQGYKGTEMFRWEFWKWINHFVPAQVLSSDIQQHSACSLSCHFQKPNCQFPEKRKKNKNTKPPSLFCSLPVKLHLSLRLEQVTFCPMLVTNLKCSNFTDLIVEKLSKVNSYLPISTFKRKGKYLFTKKSYLK